MPLVARAHPAALPKQGKPPKSELRGILDLEFANVLTSHGTAVVGGARDHYRPAVERASA